MKSTFAEIKFLVDQFASKINIPLDQLPTYGYSRDLGFPHIEIGSGGLVSYVAMERGQETYRYSPVEMDDLLYKIFEGATFSMALSYELKHRIKGQDFRRIYFTEHERLMGLLNKAWETRMHQHHQEVLNKHPFDDKARERVDYLSQLKSNGTQHNQAWELACEKYPLPG
jgi:hypothetical protein